jgi:ABC-2 type transport system ATP-binding protein
MNYSFEFIDTVKEFKDFKLGPLKFGLEPGSVMAYIGPNGSGKTTSLYLLSGHQQAKSGTIEIFGQQNSLDKIDWKYKIGFVSDEPSFFSNWDAVKNLKFISGFYPKWSNKRTDELINRLSMPTNKKVKDLSKGNLTKLSIIAALSHNPQLLILDEPTDGLDPVIRTEFFDLLYEYMEDEENSIIYSTHALNEINRLSDKLAFLNNGQIKMISDTESLIEKWRIIEIKGIISDGNNLNFISENLYNNGISILKVSDYITAMKYLMEKEIKIINEKYMSIEEISISIIKEDYR